MAPTSQPRPLQRRILLLDGAMGSMIQTYSLSEDDFRGETFAQWPVKLAGNNDLIALTRPDVLASIHRLYLEAGRLNVELLGQGFTWLDTGTHESLAEATNFVKTVETHQHRKIACLEEIAYLNGWITKEQVMSTYEVLKKNQYGRYLLDVLEGKFIDILP